MKSRPHLDYFTGVAGFLLAAKIAGLKPIAAVENDPKCQLIINKRFPNIDIYEEARDFNKRHAHKYANKVFCLSGGFPCQPYSVAGSREGINDERYLWPTMLEGIEIIRPRCLLLENVPGLFSMVEPCSNVEVEYQNGLFGENISVDCRSEQRYLLAGIWRDIKEVGYTPTVLNIGAQALQASHARQRCWIVAYANNT